MVEPRTDVTIIDIAREAGVSRATVSRALRYDADTSAKTREHVLATAQRLGYVANAHARALRATMPLAVGAVLGYSAHPIYGALHVALQERADEVGMSVVAMTAIDPDQPANGIRSVETLLQLRVGGLLICSGTLNTAGLEPHLGRVPLVSVARPEEHPMIHSVSYDDAHIGETLAAEVLRAGHRKVAVHTMVAKDSASGFHRLTAAVATLQSGGADVTTVPYRHDHDAQRGLAEVGAAGCTALICANDAELMRYLSIARAKGISVPGDLSLVGCDGVPPLADPALGLTSYRLPVTETAIASIDLMDRLLREPDLPVVHQRIPGEFLPGGTLGAV